MSAHHGICALVFLLIVIQATAQTLQSSSDPLTLIKSLASSGRSPVIVIVEPKNSESQLTHELKNLFDNDGPKGTGTTIDYERDEDRDAKEEAKAMLYSYLRSSPYDSEREQEKKHALREALRQRCQRITICVEECPAKKKPNCPKKCEKKHDKEQLCPPRWGSTMPPKRDFW